MNSRLVSPIPVYARINVHTRELHPPSPRSDVEATVRIVLTFKTRSIKRRLDEPRPRFVVSKHKCSGRVQVYRNIIFIYIRCIQ